MRKQPPLNFDNDPRDDEVADLREKLRVAEDTLVRLQGSESEQVHEVSLGEDPDIPRFSFDARPGLYLVTMAWVVTIRIVGVAGLQYMGWLETDELEVLNKICMVAIGLPFLAWMFADYKLHGWMFISRFMWVGLGLCVNGRIIGLEKVTPLETVLIWAIAVFCLLIASSSAVPYAMGWLQRFLDHPRKTIDEVKRQRDKGRTD